jgi:hypothetical protein
VTGNEVPNSPSVAATASEIERNTARDCHQERFAVANLIQARYGMPAPDPDPKQPHSERSQTSSNRVTSG